MARALLERYLRHFQHTWSDDTPASEVRFVVLDSETTGLDPRKDRLITIGAVAVRGDEIVLEDSFEALIKVAYNTSSVTVHGITRDDTLSGLEEPEALERFLDYLADGVIVGHHIKHDVDTLNAGYERNFGFQLQNRFLDTMALTLNLEKDGAFAHRGPIRQFELDALCEMFDVVPHDRHTAPGDAFITAQVFLRLLRLGRRYGRTTLGAVAERYEAPAEV